MKILNRTSNYFLLALVAVVLGLTVSAQADPIVYGDIVSEEVAYLQITENSVTDPFPDPPAEGFAGLYGEPTLLGDALVFNVPTFAATAVGGPSVDLTDGFLTFGLEAADDIIMERLYIEEFGSVNLLSPLGGSDLTNVGVVAPVFLDIQEVVLEDGTLDGRRMSIDEPITIDNISLRVDPEAGADRVFGFASEPFVKSWFAEVDIDLVAELVTARPDILDEGEVRGVTRLQFSMNNTLSASAEDEFASAFIDKKQVSINPTLRGNVPEPGIPLALLVLLGGLACRRRVVS